MFNFPTVRPEPAINCAVCGKPTALGEHGWFCGRCNAYTETDSDDLED